jgi:hypothetical protein
MVLTQYFLQSPQLLVAEVVEHLQQQPQTQAVLVVAVAMAQLLAVLEIRQAHHRPRVTMAAQLQAAVIQALAVEVLVQ